MRFTAMLAFLFFCINASAKAQSLYVERSWTCSDWAELRSERNAYPLEEHFVGMLNGMALGSLRDFWRVPVPIEPSQAFYWLDRYCANNPLDIMATAASVLVKERLGSDWNTRWRVASKSCLQLGNKSTILTLSSAKPSHRPG